MATDTETTKNAPAARGAFRIRKGCEYFDTMLWKLRAERPDVALLGVTGCGRRQGVSTIAVNLAIRAADSDLGRVLLVDANILHPSLARLLNVDASPGLADVVGGGVAIQKCVRETRIEGLRLLTAGCSTKARTMRCERQQLKECFAELREDYDLVLVDLPPVEGPGPGFLLASLLDGVLLVIASEKISTAVAEQAKSRLLGAGAELVGAVLNRQKQHMPRWLNPCRG